MFSLGSASPAVTPGHLQLAQTFSTRMLHSRILLNLGFGDRILSMDEVENGGLENFAFTVDSPALVAHVRMIGLERGDIPKLVLRDPNGSVLVQSDLKPLDRPKAQFLTQVGRKRPAVGWSHGPYEAEYSVIREGKSVIKKRFTITVLPGQ